MSDAAATSVRTEPVEAQPFDKLRANGMTADMQRIWSLLEQIPDPEIPVVSLRELGILRDVRQAEGGVEVIITPTYNGCPAMEQIEDDIRAALAREGIAARVVSQLAPAWTTDWISTEAKEKLRAYGIAPPHATDHACANSSSAAVVQFAKRNKPPLVPCPQCGSHNTTETSHFGSTACKALYRCLDCMEPFDYFKPY